MIAYIRLDNDKSKQLATVYCCSQCGTLISSSKAHLRMNGTERHSFVNPSGIPCNFMTLSHCENVVVHEDLFLEHSWFVGYGWRFLLCCTCFQHLGWKYDALKSPMSPESFFGVLVNVVETCPAGE